MENEMNLGSQASRPACRNHLKKLEIIQSHRKLFF